MSSFKEPIRDYSFSDARLIEIANEKIAFARRDATELATVGITEAWVDDLEEQVTAFLELPSDEVELGEQEEATDVKDSDADLLLDKVKELRSAAKRAFGEKHADYKQFGFKELDDKNDAELLKTAVVAKGVAVTHAAALATKGWDAADNTALQTLIDSLGAGLTNKSIEVGSRDSATENRVTKGNELYDPLANELCEAGKEYWRTRSEAKYNDYIIYNTSSGSSVHDVTRQGDLGMNVSTSPSTEDIHDTPTSTVHGETPTPGATFLIYSGENVTDPPSGPTINFTDITPFTLSVEDFKTAIGSSDLRPFIIIKNTGPLPAHWVLVFGNVTT